MADAKNRYVYGVEISNLDKARVTILPTLPAISGWYSASVPSQTNLTGSQKTARNFIESASKNSASGSFDNFFQNKLNLVQDKTDLVLGEIEGRENMLSDNLAMLYDELLMIDNWRLKRPFPEIYTTDKIWLDLNKMELNIREQIRKELTGASRDLSFTRKDLRESLLEFKTQYQKSKMVEGGLEMELDGSQKYTGDLNYTPYQNG